MFANKLIKLYNESNALLIAWQDKYIVELFGEGNILMTPNYMYQAEFDLTEMTDTYVVLPSPLLMEGENYTSCLGDSVSQYGIPYTTKEEGLDIQAGSEAYMSGTTTVASLTNSGDVNVLSGTTTINSATSTADSSYNIASGAGLTVNSLSVGGGATVSFSGGGNLTLGSLTNQGTLDFSEMTGVLGSYTVGEGFSLSLGNVANGGELNWNKLLGNSTASGFNAVYNNGSVSVVAITNPTLTWAPAEGNQSWNGNYSWKVDNVWGNPTAADTYVLGADAANKTIVVDSDVDLSSATVAVNGAYSLSVAKDGVYTFNLNDDATKLTYAEGASLTKVGEGTLSMSAADANASKIYISEGTLKIAETLAQVGYKDSSSVDLSGLKAGVNGVLSIAASGSQASPGSGTTTYVSHITLGSDFKGVVEVRSGKLHVATTNAATNGSTYGKPSNLGGATGIRLDGGGLLISSQGASFDNRQVFALNLEVGTSGGYIDLFGGSTNVQDGWSATHTGTMSGSGTLTFIGMGEWVLAGDYSAFTGGLALGSQSQRLYISSDMENLKSLDWNSAYPHENKATVVVGYGNTSGVKMTVADKQTVSYHESAILLMNGSTFTHTGGVSIADNTTFKVTSYNTASSGIYNTANVEFATATSKLAVAGKVVANITGTAAYTATCGTIDIAADSTVNDYRVLTIAGAFNITGSGTYNQLGTLSINSDGTLTLNGVVSIAALAGNNAGTLNLNGVSSLTLSDFVIGRDYAIGSVVDGSSKNWYSLLGYDAAAYSIEYVDGVLRSSQLGYIIWSSPADDDITWNGAGNWLRNGTEVTLNTTDAVLLDTIDRTAENPVSDHIKISSNVVAGGIIVKDAYTFTVDAGGEYTLDAPITLEANGSLSKDGDGKLTLTSGLTTNEVTVSAGTLAVNDVTTTSGTTFTKSGAGTMEIGSLTANEANVTGQLTVDSVTLASGNTFTKSGAGNMDLGTTNAAKLMVNGGDLELTAMNLAAGSTLTKDGSGTLRGWQQHTVPYGSPRGALCHSRYESGGQSGYRLPKRTTWN